MHHIMFKRWYSYFESSVFYSVITHFIYLWGTSPTTEAMPLLSPQSLQEVSALEGQLVVLECRMKGVPSPRVEWYREGTVIEDSPDFRILQKSRCSFGSAVLIVPCCLMLLGCSIIVFMLCCRICDF